MLGPTATNADRGSLNHSLIPISKNKVSHWLEDFFEELFLEIAANHMMVSKIERTVLQKKIKKNLILYFL